MQEVSRGCPVIATLDLKLRLYLGLSYSFKLEGYYLLYYPILRDTPITPPTHLPISTNLASKDRLRD